LFANNTIEGNYGINAVNDLGQRVISTVYPNSRFLGKLSLSGQTPSKYDTTTAIGGEYSYRCNTNSIAYTPTSANHSTLVFWSIPSSTSTDLWYSGKPTLFVNAGNANGTMYYRGASGFNGALPALPEAFAFETGPYIAASSTYGVRVFDASGNVMFDGGTPQLVILGMITGASYTSTLQSWTLPGTYTPAVFCNQYVNERKGSGCNIDGAANLYEYWGMVRRNGTTLYTQRIMMNNEGDFFDCRDTQTDYYYGNSTGIVFPILNATQYGGAAI